MSLLSHNELRIVLGPERIALLQTTRMLTPRGYRSGIQSKRIIPCEAPLDGETPWHSAVKTLEVALPSLIKPRMHAKVTIANHFMRYLLVPWIDKMSDEEELSFARHCFRETYGDAADTWTVRISPGRVGAASLASAVDTGLLEKLRGSLGQQGLDIKSIQPHLMVAFNSCQAGLENRSTWVALLEPGSLCLAVLQKGQFVWIRKLRIGEAWSEELATILDREACMADAEGVANEVLLWAPHVEKLDFPSSGRWKIQHLKPGLKPARRTEVGGLQILAAVA